jgi:hypothetical protein
MESRLAGPRWPVDGFKSLRLRTPPQVVATDNKLSFVSTLLYIPNHANLYPTNTMAASSTCIPRFLLPRLSWSQHAQSSFHAAARIHASTLPSASMSYTTRALSRAQHFPSTSRIAFGQAAVQHRRHFSATTQRKRDHHFDTLKFVQRLQDEGFTEEQAVAMMKVLSDVVEERYATAQAHAVMSSS